MKQCFLLLSAIVVFSCSVNTSKKIDVEALTFSYTDDAYIFFRNMRQTNYDLEVLEESDWRIYRHKDRKKDTSSFYFTVALVVDWRMNRVYPIVEMPIELKNESVRIQWEALEGNAKGEFQLQSMRRDDERKLAAQIYNQAMEEVKMTFISGDIEKPLFANSAEKEAFRVSMYDYFRMTALL